MIKIEPKTPGSMDINAIVGKYKTTTLNHHDGNRRTVYYTNAETGFSDDEKICSCTTPEGHITMANSAFVRMSGYTKKELMGMPHYILHHPEMPKSAFREMWASLKAEGRWEGYVKNLRKDGGYYWVYAEVFSNFRRGELVGYTSARRAITNQETREVEEKYAKLLAEEISQQVA